MTSTLRAPVCQGKIKKRYAGDRLPASYVNFYLGNGGAVVPAFGEDTDELWVSQQYPKQKHGRTDIQVLFAS